MKMKVFVSIFLLIFLSGCSWFVKERVVYRCPIPAHLIQQNKIPVNDIDTVEDSEQEVLQLYETLGQCSVDKKEIQEIVKRINKESE